MAAAAKVAGIKKERDRVFVENYGKDQKDEVKVSPELKETVYFGNIEGGTFKIESKCKGITINKCKNCSIVFPTIVGNLEIANSSKVQIQATGDVPIIQIDGSERLSIYISDAKCAESVKIYSAKSTSNNVYFPSGEDMAEFPLPEQFVSLYKGGKLESNVASKGE